jgi:hypothetical protein
MSQSPTHNETDDLIRHLATDLAPVQRLPSPGLRALMWLAVVAALALAFMAFSDLTGVTRRLAAAPDMWMTALASAATTVFAAMAAFHLSVPGRSRAWALLPLPAALIWIAAAGAGCLRSWLIPGAHPATMGEEKDCLIFIVAVSVPLSLLLILMLRRAFPLDPGLTAAMAGLASAAAAASLLSLFHPFDASATDLTVHAFAVSLVIVANRFLGRRTLAIAGRPART